MRQQKYKLSMYNPMKQTMQYTNNLLAQLVMKIQNHIVITTTAKAIIMLVMHVTMMKVKSYRMIRVIKTKQTKRTQVQMSVIRNYKVKEIKKSMKVQVHILWLNIKQQTSYLSSLTNTQNEWVTCARALSGLTFQTSVMRRPSWLHEKTHHVLR